MMYRTLILSFLSALIGAGFVFGATTLAEQIQISERPDETDSYAVYGTITYLAPDGTYMLVDPIFKEHDALLADLQYQIYLNAATEVYERAPRTENDVIVGFSSPTPSEVRVGARVYMSVIATLAGFYTPQVLISESAPVL